MLKDSITITITIYTNNLYYIDTLMAKMSIHINKLVRCSYVIQSVLKTIINIYYH